MGKQFIIVAGNIGVGKTSLAELIANLFGFKALHERVETNPYLTPFYKDMKQYAYKLQRFFLFTRIVDHETATASPKSCVQDRSVYEDAEIFAKNLHEQGIMTDDDYKLYQKLYKETTRHLELPSLIIYLKADTDLLRERIKRRGREFEKDLLRRDNDYLERLNDLYEEWIAQYPGKKLILEAKKFDFVNKPEDLQTIVQRVKSNLEGENRELKDFFA